MHIPVLSKEVLTYLAPEPNENFIDATFGFGGHTKLILEKTSPHGKVLGIEIDSDLYEKVKKEMLPQLSSRKRLIFINESFTRIQHIVSQYRVHPIHGVLFDLGMSSWHLEESGRGFSFVKDEPLLMRYDGGVHGPNNIPTAYDLVNFWKEDELASIFRIYGEERFAKRIARGICEARKEKRIITAKGLADIITKSYPQRFFRTHSRERTFRLHPATRVFQALRIAVNNELQNIQIALPQAFEVLEPGGRLVVISFHSLEDRIVKHLFRGLAKERRAELLTTKPIQPQRSEISINPRSRSAKLRALRKI